VYGGGADDESSIMVERVAVPCVLTVRCTTWMNFV
jgi:hypothetical protein